MPWLRIILAVLIGSSLAVTPVAAAVAKPMAAMEHCDKKGMSTKDMGATAATEMPDCCCNKANACSADACAVKCFKSQCALPTATKMFGSLRHAYETSTADIVALSAWPPPAPPPRA